MQQGSKRRDTLRARPDGALSRASVSTRGCALTLACLVGCAAPRDQPVAASATGSRANAAVATAPKLWTRSFAEKAVLSAAVVEIEGPELLRERAVLRRDEFNHEYAERASADGYLLEQRQRQDSDGSPIRAQLDELVIDAYERITIRIRPDAQRVVLRASGEVFLFTLSSGRETRTSTLTLVGELDTPLAP